ncbi:hypothetical protein E1292_40095 [Nonomuraea deserti]|uniref:Uncharacterized protein n=1 Tax=Nonomuraea deserti TaxID=1848322 RepID=A0A4R4UYA1_9ACTN|nr:hypothetical protein [Nonomuraea deserti]TDC94254.1 hypothetical protein E1292_40095 [Nonomuraea deserti]
MDGVAYSRSQLRSLAEGMGDMGEAIQEAYALPPGERNAAVPRIVKSLLGSGRFREQAVSDHRIFRLDHAEIEKFREAHSQLVTPSDSASP